VNELADLTGCDGYDGWSLPASGGLGFAGDSATHAPTPARISIETTRRLLRVSEDERQLVMISPLTVAPSRGGRAPHAKMAKTWPLYNGRQLRDILKIGLIFSHGGPRWIFRSATRGFSGSVCSGWTQCAAAWRGMARR